MTEVEKFSELLQDSPSSGTPLLIPVELIQEKDNLRKHFDEDALNELANSIQEQGVKSPISVHRNGDKYTINHGARRFRAAKIAGLKTIPAFLDEDYHTVDQFIENVQRENLTLEEIRDALIFLTNNGMSKKELGKRIGKSAGWITQHMANVPEKLQSLMKGTIQDATTAATLASASKKHPGITEKWVKANPSKATTRKGIKGLVDALKEEPKIGEKPTSVTKPIKNEKEKPNNNYNIKQITISVNGLDDVSGFLVQKQSSDPEKAWVEINNDLKQIPIKDIRITKILAC